jgi:hypothetical protein
MKFATLIATILATLAASAVSGLAATSPRDAAALAKSTYIHPRRKAKVKFSPTSIRDSLDRSIGVRISMCLPNLHRH